MAVGDVTAMRTGSSHLQGSERDSGRAKGLGPALRMGDIIRCLVESGKSGVSISRVDGDFECSPHSALDRFKAHAIASCSPDGLDAMHVIKGEGWSPLPSF